MSWVSKQRLNYFAEKFGAKVSELFVKKEAGKGLSTNDYTTEEKNKLAGIAAGAEVNVQADWNETTTTSDAYIKNKPTSMPASDVSAWAKAATKPDYAFSEIKSKPTTLAGYGITDAAAAKHTHAKEDITSVNASAIEGVINIANLPAGALERLHVVANDTARFALTTATVQTGDTVKVTDTGKMYFVKDDSKLNSEAGYEVYTAGTATSVPFSGVTGLPTTLAGYGITDAAAKVHTHTLSEITDFSEITESEIDTIVAGAFA